MSEIKKSLIPIAEKFAEIQEMPLPLGEGLVWRCWISKIDESYICPVDDAEFFNDLLDLGVINFQNAHGQRGNAANIGFSPLEEKWYGWSHRAVSKFGVGSECKKGDCHYVPANKQDFISACIDFWSGPEHEEVAGIEVITEDGVRGVQVTYRISDTVPNKDARGAISCHFNPFPDAYGKGEWRAETLDDAKQMAIDFADGVG